MRYSDVDVYIMHMEFIPSYPIPFSAFATPCTIQNWMVRSRQQVAQRETNTFILRMESFAGPYVMRCLTPDRFMLLLFARHRIYSTYPMAFSFLLRFERYDRCIRAFDIVNVIVLFDTLSLLLIDSNSMPYACRNWVSDAARDTIKSIVCESPWYGSISLLWY